MTKKEKATLAEALQRMCADLAVLACLFGESVPESKPAPEEKPAGAEPESEQLELEIPAEETPEKEYKYEDVRAILAEKARTGYRAEVKALLTRHDVCQLSDVTDPREFAKIVAEAEEIGNG